jgi:pimeloyl-ACP methyl ester carboxylesterase
MPDHELVRLRQLPTWERRVQLAPTIAREVAIDRTYGFEPGRFADLRTPTLLLLGGDSPELFQRATEVVNQAVAGSKVVVLPGQQHIAMDTNPEVFLGEVIEFLTV